MWEQLRGRRRRLQAARGLGHDARRDRRLPAGGRRVRACRWRSTPTRSTRPASSRTPCAAIGGRSIHAYHTEGAGGGHAPDIITVAGAPERAAVVDQPDPAVHRQHARRAPRHADGLPPPQPGRARGPGVRREPHPAVHDGRRGRAARPRRDLDDRLGLAGDGPGRRGRPAHLADRARDEGPPRRAARRRRRRQPCGPGATSPSTRSARPSRTASTARSARSRPASSPTWCCGTRRSSAYARTW